MTEEQYRKLLAYQTNEGIYGGLVQDQDGTAYRLNPIDDSIDYINSSGKKINVSKAQNSEMYDAMLNELYRYNSVESSVIPETDSLGLPVSSVQGAVQGKKLTPVSDIVPALPGSTTVLPKTSLKETEAAVNKKAQQTDLAWKLGPAAVVGALQGGIQLFQKTAQDKYAEEELKRLQEKKAKGELGLTAAEQSMIMETQLAPVKAMAREQRLRQESSQAATGLQASAAQQQSSKEAQATAVANAGRKAGLTLSQAQMAKADQELKKMESLIAYKGQRQQQKRDRAWAGASGLGRALGLVMGASSVKVDNNVDVLFNASELMEEPLSTKQLVQLNNKLTRKRSWTKKDFDAELKAVNINPENISAQDRALFYQAVT
tara:strand:- start:269 stop:1393 length:1125 start_codon:yes stop_codon:yes gene_type:complete